MIVDPSGTLHVAWYTGRESAPGLFYTTSDDQGFTFEDPEPLLSSEWVPPSQVSLSADADGSVWMAWEDRRSDAPSFYYMKREAGGALDAESGTTQAGTNPVFTNVEGAPVLAWLEGESVRARRAAR